MQLLPLVTTFQQLGTGLLTQNLFHAYKEVFTYFLKATIVISAKYVVTFRISCLLTILSQTDENFNVFQIKENGNCFIDWVFHNRDVLQLKEDIEKTM